jgi:hypothetical protein
LDEPICWTCKEPLASHTAAQRELCDKEPLAAEATVIHMHPAEMESRIIARVMSVLAQLRPIDK